MPYNPSVTNEFQLEITTRLTEEVSPELKIHITKAVEKLQKFHNQIIGCQIILDNQKSDFITEINLHVHKHLLSVTVSEKNLRKSIDQALDKMKTKVKRFNAKLKNHRVTKDVIALEERESISIDEIEDELETDIEEGV